MKLQFLAMILFSLSEDETFDILPTTTYAMHVFAVSVTFERFLLHAKQSSKCLLYNTDSELKCILV